MRSIDDFEVLQKAYVDLDIAKTISLSAKSNMKRRNILIRSARRRNNQEEIQAVIFINDLYEPSVDFLLVRRQDS